MATNNRRNDLVRALHRAYQEAENDLKNMRHARDYWKNKYESLGWGNERKNEWRTPEGECLPCPYCGGLAETVRPYAHISGDTTYMVKCQDCHCGTPYFDNEKEAITCWNRRAQ